MLRYEYGNKNSENVLIQTVDDHDISEIPDEIAKIRELAKKDFCLIALKVNSWNHDLSPWKAPAVFGGKDFGGHAKETLAEILKITAEPKKKYYIGGYSLAGLFALWAAYQTNVFAGVASALPGQILRGFAGRSPMFPQRKIFSADYKFFCQHAEYIFGGFSLNIWK